MFNPDKWTQATGGTNSIMKVDNKCWISYNPMLSAPMGITMLGSDDGMDETALCVDTGKGTRFYILNGDFREDYEKLVDKGVEACMQFYRDNIDKVSSWSDDLPTIN